MKCDLDANFRELANSIPVDEKQSFTFTPESFSEFPAQFETDRLVIKKTQVNRDGMRTDRLQFFAQKATYRELGLLILAVVFRLGGSRVHLSLTQPSSAIVSLIIEYKGSTLRVSGHHTIPQRFLFYPERIATHPWLREGCDLFGFPKFTLTNRDQCVVSEEQWAKRDTLIGFGNDDASVRLASLLLRFGSPHNEIKEVVLEGEGGFRGVSMQSAEAAFHLPGSLTWPDDVELS